MNNDLFDVIPSDETYLLGNAHTYLSKQASDTVSTYALHGKIYLANTGWLLLDVPNSFVRGAFDALHETGVELPLNSEGVLNGHITVMTKDEVDKIGPDKITERGHFARYQLGPLRECNPTSWDDVSKVWMIEVKSPDLKRLRQSYGLSALPKEDHEFHITVARRKKNVLKANDVSKAASILDSDYLCMPDWTIFDMESVLGRRN